MGREGWWAILERFGRGAGGGGGTEGSCGALSSKGLWAGAKGALDRVVRDDGGRPRDMATNDTMCDEPVQPVAADDELRALVRSSSMGACS